VAFGIGYSQERLELTVYIILAVGLLTGILVGPAWPLFKRNEPKWLEPVVPEGAYEDQEPKKSK